MIKSLYIKNFILIDELFLDFEAGINAFMGETGAGKTIILRAIDIAFGAKVNKEVIKNEAQSALIEVSFDDCGKEVIISREITQTGTKPRINGAFVNLDEIKLLREKLIDIHSQHQTYTYLAPKYHIELLDSYIAKDEGDYLKLLEDYEAEFLKFKQISEKIEKLKQNNDENARAIDFLKFQIAEIEDAEIKEGEEDELHSQLEVLENAQNLKETAYGAYFALSGENDNINDAISKISSELSRCSKLDKNLGEIYDNFLNIQEELKDSATSLRNYYENLQDDPQMLDEINERLSLIEKLKRKYGENLTEILEGFKKELEVLTGSENNLDILCEKYEKLHESIKEKASAISALRKEKAGVLSSKIESQLQNLELKGAKFAINFEKIEYAKNGCDKVEFLITTNVSQPLMPLARCASGGEMSRVMLAIKIIFAQIDKIKTIIFDEIDTGISGRASQSVANALVELSHDCQIFIITHQAIIASCATTHFWVSKTQDSKTAIAVEKLDESGKLQALARLASGEVTQSSLAFARELANRESGAI